jgi:hypothetical protein
LFFRHKDPLLDNDCEKHETTAIDMQQLRKYATTLEPLQGSDPGATVEILLEGVFSVEQLRGCITRPT